MATVLQCYCIIGSLIIIIINMGLWMTREQKVEKMIDRIEEAKSTVRQNQSQLERDRQKLIKELKAIPVSRRTELEAKALLIAKNEQMGKVLMSQQLSLDSLKQRIEETAMHSTMVDTMGDIDKLLVDIRADTQSGSVTTLINQFGRNQARLETDQENMRNVLSLDSAELNSNAQDLVSRVLTEHHINLEIQSVNDGTAQQQQQRTISPEELAKHEKEVKLKGLMERAEKL